MKDKGERKRSRSAVSCIRVSNWYIEDSSINWKILIWSFSVKTSLGNSISSVRTSNFGSISEYFHALMPPIVHNNSVYILYKTFPIYKEDLGLFAGSWKQYKILENISMKNTACMCHRTSWITTHEMKQSKSKTYAGMIHKSWIVYR